MKIHLFSINNEIMKIYFSEQFQEQTKNAARVREFHKNLIIIYFHIHYNTLKNVLLK